MPGNRYPFSMSYDRIGAAEIVLAEARRVQADFVILPSFMLHYAAVLKRSKFRVIADAIDVLTELSAQFLATYGKNALGRLGLYANYLASRSQERIFLPQCCEIWATSPPEAEALARIAPHVNVIVVANSLDESAFQPGRRRRMKMSASSGPIRLSPTLKLPGIWRSEYFLWCFRKIPRRA